MARLPAWENRNICRPADALQTSQVLVTEGLSIAFHCGHWPIGNDLISISADA
jgi:hypothetical protein